MCSSVVRLLSAERSVTAELCPGSCVYTNLVIVVTTRLVRRNRLVCANSLSLSVALIVVKHLEHILSGKTIVQLALFD